MGTYSNQLAETDISIGSSAISIAPFKPSAETDAGQSESLEMRLLYTGHPVGAYKLKADLLVEIRRTWEQCIASTWLEGVIEYGAGNSDTEAIVDLVSSLGDYRISLMRRKDSLGESAKRDLELLQQLIG